MMTYKIDHDKLDYLKKVPNFTEKLRMIRKENDCELGEAVDIMYNQEVKKLSGWVIEFESGRKIILDEYNYKLYQQSEKTEKVICENHYFLLEIAIKRNPDARDTFIKREIFEKLCI